MRTIALPKESVGFNPRHDDKRIGVDERTTTDNVRSS
jgi:hypothetical protein